MRKLDETKLEQTMEYINQYQKKNGRSPSFRMIAHEIGYSLQSAQRYVAELKEGGLVQINSLGSIETPYNLDNGNNTIAPIVGSVVCGQPILAIQNIEQSVQLPDSIFGSYEKMILIAKGDSMINADIHPGDLVVAEVTNIAKNGELVVALLGDEATLKRFYKRDGKVILHPENPKYEDIIVDDVSIQGVIRQIIHKAK